MTSLLSNFPSTFFLFPVNFRIATNIHIKFFNWNKNKIYKDFFYNSDIFFIRWYNSLLRIIFQSETTISIFLSDYKKICSLDGPQKCFFCFVVMIRNSSWMVYECQLSNYACGHLISWRANRFSCTATC